LDDFHDFDRRLDGGPDISFWRKCPPLIARGCSNRARNGPHVSPPIFQTQIDHGGTKKSGKFNFTTAEQFAGASQIKFISYNKIKEQYL